MSQQYQFCTFYLDNLLFGIEVEHVQEILLCQDMTPVPLAPPVLRGLINLRGQIVTAVDLRLCLDLPPRPETDKPFNVVVQTDEGVLSFLVDAIGDVIEVDDNAAEPIPATLKGTLAELLLCAFKLEDRLLLVMDADRVTERTLAQRGT